MTTTTAKPALWTPGDWNALFGFGTNILVNLLVLTGLLRFVLQIPGDIVFGRILPAAGLMMALSTWYYAFLAYRLAARTGRNDVCALPSGISVPHMFVVVLVIMLPIAQRLVAGTGNDYLFGTSGNNTLVDGVGNNYMRGGDGQNTYVFTEDHSGHDVIAGFKDGVDHLQIRENIDGSALVTAADVLATATADSAGNAVLHLSANDDIVLLGVDPHHLSAVSIAMVH